MEEESKTQVQNQGHSSDEEVINSSSTTTSSAANGDDKNSALLHSIKAKGAHSVSCDKTFYTNI